MGVEIQNMERMLDLEIWGDRKLGIEREKDFARYRETKQWILQPVQRRGAMLCFAFRKFNDTPAANREVVRR